MTLSPSGETLYISDALYDAIESTHLGMWACFIPGTDRDMKGLIPKPRRVYKEILEKLDKEFWT